MSLETQFRTPRVSLLPAILTSTLLAGSIGFAATTHQYLFVGHPRDDGPGEIVQRDVERIDFSGFDLLLLGGGQPNQL